MKYPEPRLVYPSNKGPEAGGFIPLRLPLNHPNFNPTQLIWNSVKFWNGD